MISAHINLTDTPAFHLIPMPEKAGGFWKNKTWLLFDISVGYHIKSYSENLTVCWFLAYPQVPENKMSGGIRLKLLLIS